MLILNRKFAPAANSTILLLTRVFALRENGWLLSTPKPNHLIKITGIFTQRYFYCASLGWCKEKRLSPAAPEMELQNQQS